MGLLDTLQRIVAADYSERLHELEQKMSDEWRKQRWYVRMKKARLRYATLRRTIWNRVNSEAKDIPMEEPKDDGLVAHVARAIYESYCNSHVMSPLGMLIDWPEWDELGDDERRDAMRDAKAAIAAVDDYWARIADEQFDENAKTSPG